MSTPVRFDFTTGLPPGERPSRVALADVYELGANGELGSQVADAVVVELKPRRGRPATSVAVRPGTFFIRLRTPEGRLLTQRVHVNAGQDGSFIVFQPKSVDRKAGKSLDDLVVSRVKDSDVLAPATAYRKEAVRRELWSAFSLDQTASRVTLSNLPGLYADKLVEAKHDFLGIAKLQTDIQVGRSVPRYFQEDLTERLVGNIAVAQSAKVRGNKGGAFATWKAPVRNRQLSGDSSAEGKGKRYYALSYRAETQMSPIQLACIPGRWRKRQGGHAEVSTNFYQRDVGDTPMHALRVEVDDPDLGGLLDFLQQGDRDGSTLMFSRVEELLYRKWVNPYASAAAGYVLVQAGEWQSRHVPWAQWVLNLAFRYSSLPDGAILFTTLLLQSRAEALQNLHYESPNNNPFRSPVRAALEAIRRGPPLYRHGLKLMATNLAILLDGKMNSSSDKTVQNELEAASDYVRELSMRVDPNQPFCVFDVRNS